MSFSIEKQPELVSRVWNFTNWQIGDPVFWNQNPTLKLGANARKVSTMNIIEGAEVDINCKHLKHVQQRVQFSPIIS